MNHRRASLRRVAGLSLFATLAAQSAGAGPWKSATEAVDRASFQVGQGYRQVVIPGIGLNARAEFGIRKGYQENQYIRTDSWNFGADVSLRQLVPGLVPGMFPGDLSISKGHDLQFIRIFDKQSKALTALPLFPTQIPTSSDRLMSLPDGTIVKIPSRLSISLGAGVSKELLSQFPQIRLSAGINAQLFVEAQVEVMVQKVAGSGARLRLKVEKGAGYRLGFSAGAVPRYFKDIRQDTVSRRIGALVDRQLRMHFAELTPIYGGNGSLLMSDYRYDLRSPEARQAFDVAISPSLRPRAAAVMMKASRDQKDKGVSLRKLAKPALSKSEALADTDLRAATPRVERVLSATNYHDFKGSSASLSLKWLVDFSSSDRASMNRISYQAPGTTSDQERTHALLANQVRSHSSKALFGLLGSEFSRESGYVTSNGRSADNLTADGLSELGYTFEHKDTRMRSSELRAIREKFQKELGPSLYQKIAPKLDKLEVALKNSKNVSNIELRASLSQGALQLLGQTVVANHPNHLSPEAYFEYELRSYIRLIESDPNSQSRFKSGFFGLFQGLSISSTARKLAGAFTVAKDEAGRQAKARDFLRLSEGGLFSQMRVGFFLYLIEKQCPNIDLDRYVHLEMKMSGKGLEKTETVFLRGQAPGPTKTLERMVRTIEGADLPENIFAANPSEMPLKALAAD